MNIGLLIENGGREGSTVLGHHPARVAESDTTTLKCTECGCRPGGDLRLAKVTAKAASCIQEQC